jgi:hypothetical protein
MKRFPSTLSVYRRLGIERFEPRQMFGVQPAIIQEAAEGEGEQVVDFSLRDVNPNSATYSFNVSPRQFLGEMSAWYFGHAT